MSDDLVELGERIAEQAAHLDAATHRLLADVREFDARGGWRTQGAMSCAHWLAWRVGWDLVTARDHVRVARKLAEFPAIDDALRRGEVSYSKARALLRVATPANETLLLDHARLMTASQLEKLCRKYALVQRHGEDPHPLGDEQRRHVRRRDLEDGMVKIEAVLHPDEAELVWTMLNHAATRLARDPDPASASDSAESWSAAAILAPGSIDHHRHHGHHRHHRIDDAARSSGSCSTPAATASASLACRESELHDSAESSAPAPRPGAEVTSQPVDSALCATAISVPGWTDRHPIDQRTGDLALDTEGGSLARLWDDASPPAAIVSASQDCHPRELDDSAESSAPAPRPGAEVTSPPADSALCTAAGSAPDRHSIDQRTGDHLALDNADSPLPRLWDDASPPTVFVSALQDCRQPELRDSAESSAPAPRPGAEVTSPPADSALRAAAGSAPDRHPIDQRTGDLALDTEGGSLARLWDDASPPTAIVSASQDCHPRELDDSAESSAPAPRPGAEVTSPPADSALCTAAGSAPDRHSIDQRTGDHLALDNADSPLPRLWDDASPPTAIVSASQDCHPRELDDSAESYGATTGSRYVQQADHLARQPHSPTEDQAPPSSLLDRRLDEADAARAPEVPAPREIAAEPATGPVASLSSNERRSLLAPSVLHQRAGASRRAFNRADALVWLAQGYLRGDRPDRSPIEVTLTIPRASLRRGSADPVEVGEIGESFVAPETARRLSCDAGLIEVIEDEHGAPLSVGRKRRTIAGALKRALRKRDTACTFPGCTNRIFLEGHHIRHWADGGETSLMNTALLCSLHHRHVHEYGYSIELGPDRRPVFRDPRGELVAAVPSPPAATELGWPQIRRVNEPLAIHAGTIAGPWDGTPVDYGRIAGHLAAADQLR